MKPAPYQQFTDQLLQGAPLTPTAQLAAYQQFADRLMAEHGIRVKYRHAGTSGCAWIDDREIKVPYITDAYRFLVNLHEIAHIVQGSIRPVYLEEFLAEQFALEQGRLAGVPQHDLDRYANGARKYVLENLITSHGRGARMDRVPAPVREFVQQDLLAWTGRRVRLILNSDLSHRIYLS